MNIKSCVHRRGAGERVLANAKAGCQIDLALERFADRHAMQRARKTQDLNARDTDAHELPLEAAGVPRCPRWHERPAHRASMVEGRGLVSVDTQLREHAANSSRSRLVAL